MFDNCPHKPFFGVLKRHHEQMSRPSGYRVVRALARPLVRVLYRLEVRDARRVPAAGPVIVVANHESVLDPIVLGCAIERELRFLTKAELWRWRLVGRLLDLLGGIRIERGQGDRAALGEAQAALEAGQAVALFPQGSVRSQGSWHRGAAKLALATGAPLVPVRLIGTASALSRGHVGLPRLAVDVGEPIHVERRPSTIATARALTERLRAEVEQLQLR
jgi:1-acyl-sn-glycerol-3-phosphate acyltransferase